MPIYLMQQRQKLDHPGDPLKGKVMKSSVKTSMKKRHQSLPAQDCNPNYSKGSFRKILNSRPTWAIFHVHSHTGRICWSWRQEDHKFEASLGYILPNCEKKWKQTKEGWKQRKKRKKEGSGEIDIKTIYY